MCLLDVLLLRWFVLHLRGQLLLLLLLLLLLVLLQQLLLRFLLLLQLLLRGLQLLLDLQLLPPMGFLSPCRLFPLPHLSLLPLLNLRQRPRRPSNYCMVILCSRWCLLGLGPLLPLACVRLAGALGRLLSLLAYCSLRAFAPPMAVVCLRGRWSPRVRYAGNTRSGCWSQNRHNRRSEQAGCQDV